MDSKTLFDYIGYFTRLAKENKLAQSESFYPCTCSGIEYLEEMLHTSRTHANFVCVCDTCEESTVKIGGGWFHRRLITVFLVSRFKRNDMADYRRRLGVCRELLRQFQSRLLHDSERMHDDMLFIDVDRMLSKEFGGTFLDNATGLYFMLNVDEPTDICFSTDEWNAPAEP